MTRIFAVAKNTFREAVRNKILYSLLVFALALIVSALALGQLSVHEDRRMIVDVGLFGIDFFSVLIAIFVGVNLLYKELALKTVYTILPKPIARWEFILGKWLGVMATLSVQVAVMGAVLFFTLWIQGGGDDVDAAIPKALWLLFMNVTVVTSIALWFSSFSSPFLSGLLSFGVFVVGRSIPPLEQFANRVGGTFGAIVRGFTAVLPNLNLFYPSGTALHGSGSYSPGLGRIVSVHGTFVNWAYVGSSTAYALGYSALVLGAAMFIFRKRDFV